MDLSEIVQQQRNRVEGENQQSHLMALHEDKKNNLLFAASKIVQAIDVSTTRLENNQPTVTIANKDLAKTTDFKALQDALERLDGTIHAESPKDALEELRMALEAIYNKPNPIFEREDYSPILKSLEKLENTVKSLDKPGRTEDLAILKEISEAIKKIDTKPIVNLPTPKVTVAPAPIDLSPISSKLDELKNSFVFEAPVTDMSGVEDGLDSVQQSIERLIARPIPLPTNTPPFQNTNGDPTRVNLESDGSLPVTVKNSITVANDIDVNINKPTTATVTTVGDTTSSTQLIATNTNRKEVEFFNNSNAVLYLLKGTGTASATNFTVALNQGDYYSSDNTCAFRGVWSSDAGGSVLITDNS